jgi:plasmid stability protein
MKTTIDLPDDLMRAVKIRAAEHNLKLKDVVADALRAALGTPAVVQAALAGPKVTPADTTASQRRQRYAALLAQLDQVPDLPQVPDPLAWDDLGLPL